jgi:hypothetical protein
MATNGGLLFRLQQMTIFCGQSLVRTLTAIGMAWTDPLPQDSVRRYPPGSSSCEGALTSNELWN